MAKQLLTFVKRNAPEIILIVFSFAFSFWLMFSTFSYKDGSMLIAGKAWSDFASHIPLIRSFSFGNNFPPEFPLFPGEPIRYHFLFYALVGFLERIGIRIDYALNIPSAISFAALIMIIYFLAKTLFKSRAVGMLSVLFFLFNGSLSFLEFFKTHPLSVNTIKDIIGNNTFPSFAPYGKGIVSAFWNLNIYTNQRHLALPLTILLGIILLLVKFEQIEKPLSKKAALLFGILLGLLPLSHSSVFIMAYAVLPLLFFLLPRQRAPLLFTLLIGAFISLPRILFLKETATYPPQFVIGYFISDQLSFLRFLFYWFMNLGFSLILIPLGVLLSNRLAQKVFLAFFSLFFIGNLIQFSPEMAANHKFFNMFLITGNMFVAFLLVKLWSTHFFIKPLVVGLCFLLILSGVIDLFPIKNDRFLALEDYPKNKDIQWIVKNTQKDAVFLNSSYLYNTASLAGRKIFLGWPYFAWSAGYDVDKRGKFIEEVFSLSDKKTACKLLVSQNIDYIRISNPPDPSFPKINQGLIEKFERIYNDTNTQTAIYDVRENCRDI